MNVPKKYALLVVMLVLFALPAAAGQKQKRLAGIYGGWSFSLGKRFLDDSPGGHTFNHYLPNYILGFYFQRDLSPWFGLQFNMNYQNISNQWDFYYNDRHSEGTESLAAFSFNLNGIAPFRRTALSEAYFLGGIGLFIGPRSAVQLSGGAGVKLRVAPASRTVVNLAAVLHHLFSRHDGARGADYLRLQAGIEFTRAEKRD